MLKIQFYENWAGAARVKQVITQSAMIVFKIAALKNVKYPTFPNDLNVVVANPDKKLLKMHKLLYTYSFFVKFIFKAYILQHDKT